MQEKIIETYLRDQVKNLGGKAYKFVSPGNDGVPDRLVCLPGGRAVFIETKRPGEKPTSLQRSKHRELRKLGFTVFGRVDNKQKVDRALALVTRRAYLTVKDIEEMEMRDVE